MKLSSMHAAVAAGWGSRIIAAAVQLLVIRLLVDYLGIDPFALFSVFLAYWGFMAVMDYGVGPALSNRISAIRAAGGNPDGLVRTAAVVVFCIALVNLPILAVVNHVVVSYLLAPAFGDTPHLWMLSFASFALLGLRGAGEVVYRVYFAEHRGIVSVVSPAIANIIGLVFIVIAMHAAPDGGLGHAVAAVFAPFVLVTGALWAHRLKTAKPAPVDVAHIRALFSGGRAFFGYTALNAGLIQVDYLVMARIIPAEEIVAYTLLMRLSMFLLYFYAVYLQIFWPKSAEGVLAGQGGKMMHRARRAYLLGALGVLCAFGLLAPLRGFVFELFNAGSVTPGVSLVWLFGVLVLVRTWSETHATLLASANRLRLMNAALVMQLGLTVLLQVLLGLRYGAAGIVTGSVIGYAACGAWVFPWEFRRSVARRTA